MVLVKNNAGHKCQSKSASDQQSWSCLWTTQPFLLFNKQCENISAHGTHNTLFVETVPVSHSALSTINIEHNLA